MSRLHHALAATAAAAFLSGCVSGRCCPENRALPAPSKAPAAVAGAAPQAPPEPAKPKMAAFYRGNDGAETDLASALASWKDADIVAFGELHGHPVGAQGELAALKTMHGQGRPVALAMEFMERDTQPIVDAYLAGELSIVDFAKKARQGRAFARTHGPLMAFCQANEIPVIAANAPRRLVTAYRKQDKDYAGYLEGLSKEDRGWLPEDTTILDDEYRERFVSMMGEARGAAFFKSQSLWDDAMAEAMYDFRSEHPEHRILFVVGAFHVTKGLGTISKYKLRRGKDEIRILLMTMDKNPSLPFHDSDVGVADLLVKVPYPVRRKLPKARGPSPHKKKPTAPSPHTKPKTDGAL